MLYIFSLCLLFVDCQLLFEFPNILLLSRTAFTLVFTHTSQSFQVLDQKSDFTQHIRRNVDKPCGHLRHPLLRWLQGLILKSLVLRGKNRLYCFGPPLVPETSGATELKHKLNPDSLSVKGYPLCSATCQGLEAALGLTGMSFPKKRGKFSRLGRPRNARALSWGKDHLMVDQGIALCEQIFIKESSSPSSLAQIKTHTVLLPANEHPRAERRHWTSVAANCGIPQHFSRAKAD